jgi:hypothetical protein
MMRLLTLAATLVLASCKKEASDAATGSASGSATAPAAAAPKRGGGTPSADDCDKLAARTVDMSMAETPEGTPPDRVAKLKAVSEQAARAIATLCKTDGWSSEAVACGLAAKDPSRECSDKLTQVQKNKMQAQVMAIFAQVAPP